MNRTSAIIANNKTTQTNLGNANPAPPTSKPPVLISEQEVRSTEEAFKHFTISTPSASSTSSSAPSISVVSADSSKPPASNSSNSSLTSSTASQITVKMARALGYRVIREGNPKHGTILMLGQTHLPPDSHAYEEDEKTSCIAAAAASQKPILEVLTRHKIEHVFPEGLPADMTSAVISGSEYMGDQQRRARELFSNVNFSGKFNPEMNKFLVAEGAEWIHLYLHAEVVLHAPLNPQERKELFRFFDQETRSSSLNFDTAHAQRSIYEIPNRATMRTVKQFHQSQLEPNTVVVTLGSLHDPEDCARHCSDPDYSPQFFYLDTSGITKKG